MPRKPGDDEVGHGVEHLEDQIVHRIDVAPGFLGRIGARLDRVEMDAVGPEIAAAEQRDDPRRARAGVQESVAQPPALRRAHRAVVKIERKIADPVLLRVDDLAERPMIVRRVDWQRRLGHAAKRRPQHLRRGQFDPGDRAELHIAKLAAEARPGKVASRLRRAGIALGLQMGNPDRAIDRADADRAVASRQNLARRPFDAVLVMRAIEEAAFPSRRAEDAGRAVRRADLPDDRRRIVPRPVDGAVRLFHRRAQTAVRMGQRIGQRLGPPRARLIRVCLDTRDGLEDAAQGRLGDLATIEAALRGRRPRILHACSTPKPPATTESVQPTTNFS